MAWARDTEMCDTASWQQWAQGCAPCSTALLEMSRFNVREWEAAGKLKKMQKNPVGGKKEKAQEYPPPHPVSGFIQIFVTTT